MAGAAVLVRAQPSISTRGRRDGLGYRDALWRSSEIIICNDGGTLRTLYKLRGMNAAFTGYT